MQRTRTDGAKRREALLDAALKCFVKRGVLETGIEDIRKAAKASPSSVYHQFGGISDVTLALLIRTFTRLFGHLALRVTATTKAKDAVLALVDGHLEWVMQNRDEARFMYQAMSLEMSPRVSVPLAKSKAALLAPVVEHFAIFIAKGTLPAWSPLHFDVVLLGVTHEACRRFLAGAPLDPAWMHAELPRRAWRSLSA